MKVYLAHNYAAKEQLRKVKADLQSAGIEVTSRWIDANPEDPYAHTTQRDEANKDVFDVLTADALVLFTDNYGERPGRGKFVELGIAVGQHKRILLLGGDQTGCVFYHLDWVQHLPANTTVEDLVKVLTDVAWITK